MAWARSVKCVALRRGVDGSIGPFAADAALAVAHFIVRPCDRISMTECVMTKVNVFESALVNIDWPFGAEPPVLKCPITGQVVLQGYDPVTGDMAMYEEPKWSEVPTVTFCYLPEVGEFQYIAASLQTAIDETRRALIAAAGPSDVEEIEELSDFEILREHVESLGEVPLIFCLTTSGMACGPVSASVYVGLDLSAAFVAVEAEAA
jgi:hypothetical protein